MEKNSPSDPPQHDAAKPLVMLTSMCDWHQKDVILKRLRIPEDGPWMIVLTAITMLVGRWVMEDPRVVARAEANAVNLTLILAELGCPACRAPRGYTAAVHLVRTRGIRVALDVGRGATKDPLWNPTYGV